MDNRQLEDWLAGAEIEGANDAPVYFVVIKTNACPKCEHLKSNAAAAFGNLQENVAWYQFAPGPESTKITGILQELNATSAPIILYRYIKNAKWQFAAFTGPWERDYCDLRSTMDAISQNDTFFFGYDNVDNEVDSDHNYAAMRLCRLIHGELPPEVVRQHQLLQQEVDRS